VKTGWERKRLGDVCRIDRRQARHKGLPYVGLEHIEGGTGKFIGSLEPTQVKSNTFAFDAKSVLFGRLRPYLKKVLLPSFNGHCSTEIFPLQPSPTLAAEYLHYWFLQDSVIAEIDATCTGSRMPRADMDAAMDFPIPVPPLPEQRRIVAILDEAFEGIAAAKANAERNVRNAREAFYCGLDEIIKASQPEGSPCFQPLGQLVSQILDRRGVTPKKLGSDFTDAGYRVISAKNIKGRAVNLEVGESRFVDEATYTRWMATPLFEDDVILTSEAPLGEPAYISTQAEWCLGQRLFGIRTKKNILRGRFLFYALQSSPVRKDLLSRATGATAQGIRQAELVKVAIPTPSLRQQDETTQTLLHLKEATDQLTNTLSNRIAALDELKASLLHQAFTGAL